MVLGGKKYRVEINWNTLSNFLIAVGRDTLEGLSGISEMKPSEMSALVAAAVNEGQRLDGVECNMTALELGAIITPNDISIFMQIYIAQSRIHQQSEPAKKKTGKTEAK